MDLENRAKIKEIIKESLETAVFGFLCLLDGVRAIESTSTKGRLILTYEKEGQTVLLNSPDDEYLHNLL